ncbi:MAG: c-type cytochrome [Chromatiales bacterium]
MKTTRLAGGMLVGTLIAGAVIGSGSDTLSPRSTEALAFNCFTCHGPEGQGTGSIPPLHGKSADQLLRRLLEFRQGRGNPTIMDRIARGYSDEELARIADYIATLP